MGRGKGGRCRGYRYFSQLEVLLYYITVKNICKLGLNWLRYLLTRQLHRTDEAAFHLITKGSQCPFNSLNTWGIRLDNIQQTSNSLSECPNCALLTVAPVLGQSIPSTPILLLIYIQPVTLSYVSSLFGHNSVKNACKGSI